MHRMRGRTTITLGVALLLGALATPRAAQAQFDDPGNLRVLPADISASQLRDVMRGFTSSLGVRCSHCHVQVVPGDFDSFDFADDGMAPKETAREMLQMVRVINSDHIQTLTNRSNASLRVGCVTCHSGRAIPSTLQQEVTWAFDDGGVQAATDRYAALRDRYFGRGAYDFGPGTLEAVAGELRRPEPEAALALLELNIEHHPESVGSWVAKGQVHDALDQRDEAIRALERALELSPGNGQIEQMLARMRGGDRL